MSQTRISPIYHRAKYVVGHGHRGQEDPLGWHMPIATELLQ